MQTHYDRIMEYMIRFGSITTYEAFADLGETKLTTRISDMRKRGIKIRQKEETGTNRFGQPVRYNRYSLVPDEDGRWTNKAGRMIGR